MIIIPLDNGTRVTADYWAKPVPVRHYDFTATLFDGDEDTPVGYGATAMEALRDLAHALELRDEYEDADALRRYITGDKA